MILRYGIAILALTLLIGVSGCPGETGAPAGGDADANSPPGDLAGDPNNALPSEPNAAEPQDGNSPSIPPSDGGDASAEPNDPSGGDPSDPPIDPPLDPIPPPTTEDPPAAADDPPAIPPDVDPGPAPADPLAGTWRGQATGHLLRSVDSGAETSETRAQHFALTFDYDGSLRAVSLVQRVNGLWSPATVHVSAVGDEDVVQASANGITERQSARLSRLEITENTVQITLTIDYRANYPGGWTVGNGRQSVNVEVTDDGLECTSELVLALQSGCPPCPEGAPCPPGCDPENPTELEETVTLFGTLNVE